MADQFIQVTIPRTVLKPSDFSIDEGGNLKIDKNRLNTIVKENINKSVPVEDAVSVGVSVSVSF